MSEERPAHWGKRPREEDGETFVRFSELSPEEKLARRREERQEKKERDRTLGYFKSVQHTLTEQSNGGGDPGTLAGIVEGFFVELLKLLRADKDLFLLRNGTVCRVIESALANAMLIHSKSLLYVFLGHMKDLVSSPVASYVLETLLASISQALSALAADESTDNLDAEMAEGGPGMHSGSGVPSSATLLRSMVEELVEVAEDMLVHEVASRALRSIILVLGGFPIRNAPPTSHPVVFAELLGTLGEALLKALENGYCREYGLTDEAEAWLKAAQAPTTSFVVQSLLRVCVTGTPTDCVRVKLEGLQYQGRPLLQSLVEDTLGCHIVQAYIKVSTPSAVIELGDRLALKAAAAAATGPSSTPAARTRAAVRAIQNTVLAGEASDSIADGDNAAALLDCCWGRALRLVNEDLDRLLAPGSELVMQCGFILHDLALYAPTAAHLEMLWRETVHPRLGEFLDVPALAPALTGFARKCAFRGSVSAGEADASASTSLIPNDLNLSLRQDEAQHARYFATPVAFQSEVCSELCRELKTRSPKGAPQYLLVEGRLGDRGVELARYLLHLHPSASAIFRNAMDKLRLEDVLHLIVTNKGSLVFQQLLRAGSFRAAMGTGRKVDSDKAKAGVTTDSSGGAAANLRFLRRITPQLTMLIRDRYAAFVVEALYEYSPVEVKEQLVKVLVPLYEALRTGAARPFIAPPAPSPADAEASREGDADGQEGSAAPAPQTEQQQQHVARKVILNCCVEQYVHRPEDWKKLAIRQAQVQRLMWQMIMDA